VTSRRPEGVSERSETARPAAVLIQWLKEICYAFTNQRRGAQAMTEQPTKFWPAWRNWAVRICPHPPLVDRLRPSTDNVIRLNKAVA
jgi:hypothetical protein